MLLRIVAVLFPSASKAAQNKAVKMASSAIHKKVRAVHRKIRGKGKRRSKGKKRKSKSRKRKGKAHFKVITIKKRGGGKRKQRVKVLASGKFKFVKNKWF